MAMAEKSSRALVALAVMASSAGAFAACTFVNTFDDLKSIDDATAADVAVEAGTDAPGDAAAPTDAGPLEDVRDAGQRGVIVIGGQVATIEGGQRKVLTALAPEDGRELPLARETMNVTSAHYDGLRDLWYVFESGGEGFFPTPTDPVFLHVRRLDTQSGEWTELQRLQVPPTVSFATTAVIRERLGYVAYRVDDGATGFDFVTLDTSTPSAVKILDTHPLDVPPIGAIGTRSATGVGGVINLLHDGACDGSTCVELLHVTVPSNAPPTFSSREAVAGFVGSPGYGSYLNGGPSDLVVTRASTGLTTATIAMYSPQLFPPQQVAPTMTFGILGPYIKPLAFAECQQQALIVETNQDLALYAIPLAAGGGQLDRISTQHSGQGVYFEPFTSTVLTPFSQGTNFALTAFKLEGTAAAPKLVPRVTPAWAPPSELRPNVLATRVPLPIVCP
jgi:hypothetical protein